MGRYSILMYILSEQRHGDRYHLNWVLRPASRPSPLLETSIPTFYPLEPIARLKKVDKILTYLGGSSWTCLVLNHVVQSRRVPRKLSLNPGRAWLYLYMPVTLQTVWCLKYKIAYCRCWIGKSKDQRCMERHYGMAEGRQARCCNRPPALRIQIWKTCHNAVYHRQIKMLLCNT